METKDMETQRNLHAKFMQKFNRVVESVRNIEKTGNNQSQHYKYAEECEVVRHLRKAFIECGLAFNVEATGHTITHEIGQNKYPHMVVNLNCELTDTETGYGRVYKWYGAAMDSGDKVFYKAYTSGIKYFLMKTFLIPTGNDVEGDDEGDDDKPADPVPPKEKPKADTLPEPTEAQRKVITAVLNKLVDTANSKSLTLDPDRVQAVIYSAKGKYPDDLSKISSIVGFILDEKRGGIKRVCAA